MVCTEIRLVIFFAAEDRKDTINKTKPGDCSYEIKRHLFLGRKEQTNLDRVLKSRDMTLLTKVHTVKAM